MRPVDAVTLAQATRILGTSKSSARLVSRTVPERRPTEALEMLTLTLGPLQGRPVGAAFSGPGVTENSRVEVSVSSTEVADAPSWRVHACVAPR
jgi:hypothetical protein